MPPLSKSPGVHLRRQSALPARFVFVVFCTIIIIYNRILALAYESARIINCKFHVRSTYVPEMHALAIPEFRLLISLS